MIDFRKLTFHGLLLAFLLALPPANMAHAQSRDPSIDQHSQRGDLWRQVREGMQGAVSLPEKQRGVLIHKRGADWGTTRTQIVAGYGIRAMTISIIVIVSFLLIQGRFKILILPFGHRFLQSANLDRIAHWLTGGSFILLGMSGLNMLYGRFLVAPYVGQEIHAFLTMLGKHVHDNMSWVFMLGVVLLVVVWIRDHVPEILGEKLRKKREDIKNFSSGEKMVFWSVIGGGVVVSYSGIALLFPFYFGDLSQMQFLQIVHSIASLTLAALIFGHIYIVSAGVKENARKLAEAKEILEKRVEERTVELTEVNLKLVQEIKERKIVEKALQEAKNEAEQANLSKDKFLAAASHDLLQPLNAARLMVSTLRQREMREKNQDLVDRIHIALDGAEGLLTDLLDITKLDANAVSVERSHFRVRDLLMTLSTEFMPLAREAGLELRVVESDYVVHSDLHLLSRILRNYLTNAIRYTRDGGVLIGCRKDRGRIKFVVRDTGVGIPEDLLDKIFEEFHQLDNDSRLYEKGVGLGLAIVERISLILGHEIDVKSQVGRGSTFSVSVPVGDAGQVVRDNVHLGAVPKNDLSEIQALVIDNEESVLVGMRSLLTEWGCQVETFSTRNSALEAEMKPDIILADYHLDNGHLGSTLIEALRLKFGEVVPAVIITADRGEELMRSLEGQGYHVLNKPVRAGKLRALISHILHEGEPKSLLPN